MGVIPARVGIHSDVSISRATQASASSPPGLHRKRVPSQSPPSHLYSNRTLCSAPSRSCPSSLRTVAAFAEKRDKNADPPEDPERDEDGLYIGTYSNFFTDPEQIKGVVIFCAFLASFLSLGNIGAAIILPILYDKPVPEYCLQSILFGYYCS